MPKPWLLVVAGLMLAACQRGCHRAGGAGNGHVAEPGVGRGDTTPHVSFAIDAVYQRQRPMDAAPWHGPGGEWTFFDAHTADGARFGFGWTQKASSDALAFGKALWTVPDPNMGAQLIGNFSRAFEAKVPPPAPQQALHPQPFSLAVLGDNVGRDDSGFTGAGSWHATKLFLQRPGLEAELFFNFDLTDLHGEFAEKDGEYADDLMQFMARELRDGPLAPQTPENDARISLVGPKLDDFHFVAPAGATFRAFEANGTRLVYSVEDGAGTKLISMALEGPADEVELLRLEHELGAFACAANDDPCLVEGVHHPDPHVFSLSDPTAMMLLQRAAKRVVPLSGPWGERGSAAEAAVSPDGKQLAVTSSRDRAQGKGSYRVVHFVSVDAPQHNVTFAHGEDWLNVVGWLGQGAELRAVVQAGLSYDEDDPPRWFLVAPATATFTELPAKAAGIPDPTLSPDGKHRYACNKDEEILITELATGTVKRFPVVPRERHALTDGCELTWRGSRFLEFAPERTAFIDVESLKLSFPFADGAEESGAIEYDQAFKWAAFSVDSRLGVARISVR
jgi:hypothetical protein